MAHALGKSRSTAYNLLDTLCQEDFAVHEHGVYRLTADASDIVDADREAPFPAGLAGVVDEVFARTHKRVYVAAARSGEVVIPLVRGRQGMPRIPGLGPRIRENAHALAIGKIALSLLSDAELERYLERGLRAFTPDTITDAGVLGEQLADIRAGHIAFDCEEWAEDFCCVATPVGNARGQTVAAIGISMTARCFELERHELERVLADVSGRITTPALPAISEKRPVLEGARTALRGSAAAAVPTPGHRGIEDSP